MAQVKKIQVAQAKVGMKIAHNVYSELGALLAHRNTILDFRLLKMLRSLGIRAIEVFVEESTIQIDNLKSIGYMDIMEELKKFLNHYKQHNQIEFTLLTNIVEAIKEIRGNKDIVFCLNENFRPEFYTYSHSLNVALLVMMIGKWLKYSERKITQLIYAGILHDIGKLKIDPAILNKPGQLSPIEYDLVKTHAVLGYKIVEPLKFLSNEIKKSILFHHEREDGSGYPKGVKGDEIPYMAKIIAVADIYIAMTSNRVYSEEKPPFMVFKLMEDHSFGRLDLKITRTLLTNIANYYLGHRVILNNGEKGEIVFINPQRLSRPIIKTERGFVDLSMDLSLQIERMSSGKKVANSDIN